MRRAVILFAVFAVAVVAVLGLIGARTKNLPQKTGVRPSIKSTPPPASDGERTAPTSPRLAAAGHIKEAQDEYLQALMAAPGDADAMRWLVAIRRQLLGGDAAALRRQAATFEQAVASGTETAEHYTEESMRILAQADLRAAEEIEAEQAAAANRSQSAPSGPAPGAASPGSNVSSQPPAVTRPAGPSQPPATSPRGQNRAPRAGNGATPPVRPRAGVVPPRPRESARSARPPAAAAPPQKPPQANTQAQQTPASSSPPSQTATAPPAAPPATPDGQAAIPVPLPDVQPTVLQTQGVIVKVDCLERSFVLHGPQGDQEYFIVGDPPLYIRGARSERLQEFCGLQHFVGNTALAWSRVERGRRIATGVSVLTTQ